MSDHHAWKGIKSVLLVDDDADALEMYSELLKQRGIPTVIKTRYPSHAAKLAHQRFFDMVVVDVTMNYNGTMFGGLELYKALLGRFGDSSIIAYSQFITDELLKQYEYDFNFLEKSTNPSKFIDELLQAMVAARKRQTCFVAMSFDPKHSRLYRTVEKCVHSAGYDCVRIDQVQFTDSIIKRIFDGISKSKFVIFLAADRNPNAYYECGYAVALKKEVITLTDKHSNLPFDIRDRQAIAYGADLNKLGSELDKKLARFTEVAD
jgi:CheY-like chemotaxis protein